MLSARSEVAVAVVAGKVYVAGGFGGGAALEIYDPATNRWRLGAPIPRAVHHAAVAEMGGRLYFIGGYAGGWDPVDTVYEYDPTRDRWRTRRPLPTARGALVAVTTLLGRGTNENQRFRPPWCHGWYQGVMATARFAALFSDIAQREPAIFVQLGPVGGQAI